ncbi:MAG: CBS domain-containing protein [Nitrospinae bacterium]|nr:CBS domain-containing protein [Nitrospinota bacterium]
MGEKRGEDRRADDRRTVNRREGVQADSLGEYMASPVLSIEADAKIEEAAKLMKQKLIGSLLVKESGEYVGVITESDVTRKVVAMGLDPKTTPVFAVKVEKIITMEHSQSVLDANELMKENTIRHLPVTRDGKIEGMFSVKDLVGFYFKKVRKKSI